MDITPIPGLPENIAAYVAGLPYEINTVGLSGSGVYTFEDMVLKVEPLTDQAQPMAEMLCWLEDRLPVPRVISHNLGPDKSYLLMSRIPGKMSCDPEYLAQPRKLVRLLARGLEQLWEVDITHCPRDCGLDHELTLARRNVEQGRVDPALCEPDTFAENGFKSPARLLAWLEDHRPSLDPVLSHGDYCLPNVFLKDDRISGFIDLGDCGTADRWRDISLCWRSLKHNFDGTFGYTDTAFHPDLLFEELNIKYDPEKLEYYLLLDELF